MSDGSGKTLTLLLATIGAGFAIKTITSSDTLGVIALVLTGLYFLGKKD